MRRGDVSSLQMLDPKKLRVCFLAGTLGRGGAERQLIYMLRALKGLQVSVRVMSLTSGEALEDEIRSLGVPVENVVSKKTSRQQKLFRIIQSLRDDRVDVLQCVHFYTNLYAAVAGRLTRTREIGAIRSGLDFDLESNGAMGQLHLRSPRHLITNSAPSRRQAIARGISSEKIDLIPNVVDIEEQRERQSVRQDGAVRILFAGRLSSEKRVDRFLRVVAKVAQQSSERAVTAVMAGDGPLRSSLEGMASKLAMNGCALELLGEREDMGNVYQKSDLLMLTSDLEGTPNVLLEAMAHGLPIAATRVGGVPDIVHEDCGLLVDREDEDGLASAALRLVSSPTLRRKLGQNGYEYVSQYHSIEKLPEQLLSVYRKVLSL